MGELKTEQEIVIEFQRLQNQLQTMIQKIAEIEGEKHEHDQVIATLEPMDGSRRCCRLVSGVLVERTVAEILPAVKATRDNLDNVISSLKKQLEAKNKEIAAFQIKYKVRVRGQDGDAEGVGAGAESRGVLV